MELFEKYLGITLRFISYRPRSEKEVYDFLVRKKAPEEVVPRIIQTVKEQGFVDDKKFAIWWLEQRNTFRPRGARLLRLELKEKGIADAIITALLETFMQEDTQLATAKALIKKRVYKMQNISYKELKEKLGQFLERKGFDYGTIRRAIDDLDEKEV